MPPNTSETSINRLINSLKERIIKKKIEVLIPMGYICDFYYFYYFNEGIHTYQMALIFNLRVAFSTVESYKF